MKDRHVIENLGLDSVMPSYYNIDTGKFDRKKEVFLDEDGNPLNEADMDIFELARRRGVSLKELEELMNDTQIEEVRKQQKKQKHTKKDYEKLKTLSIN